MASVGGSILESVEARPESTFDLEAALNRGASLVVNCAVGRLGNQTAEALGRFLVGMILGIALNRAESGIGHRTPIWMMIDEAQNFVSDEIKVILTEARKYALHLTLATQVVGQDMTPQLNRIVLGNTAVKLLGNAGSDSITAMAKEMHVQREYLTNLAVGEFVVKCGASPPLRMKMRDDFLDRRQQMSYMEWREMCEVQLDRYYTPVDGVRRQAPVVEAPTARPSSPEPPPVEPPPPAPVDAFPELDGAPAFEDAAPFADLEDPGPAEPEPDDTEDEEIEEEPEAEPEPEPPPAVPVDGPMFDHANPFAELEE